MELRETKILSSYKPQSHPKSGTAHMEENLQLSAKCDTGCVNRSFKVDDPITWLRTWQFHKIINLGLGRKTNGARSFKLANSAFKWSILSDSNDHFLLSWAPSLSPQIVDLFTIQNVIVYICMVVQQGTWSGNRYWYMLLIYRSYACLWTIMYNFRSTGFWAYVMFYAYVIGAIKLCDAFITLVYGQNLQN